MPIAVGSLTGTRVDQLDALVDTGATYTWIPRECLQDLGVQPDQKRLFILADGREVTYDIAWVRIRINGLSQPTIAVFGDAGSVPLLGAVTLEEYGLAADPVNRRLTPVPGLLKQAV